MHLTTITSLAIILLAAVSAEHDEKKIELQDIEEDTLKTEKKRTSPNTFPVIPSQLPHLTESEKTIDMPLEKPSGLTYSLPVEENLIGYLSNVPMNVYFIPPTFGEQSQDSVNFHSDAAGNNGITLMNTNYVEVPTYLVPTVKGYMQQYSPQLTYVTYDHSDELPDSKKEPPRVNQEYIEFLNEDHYSSEVSQYRQRPQAPPIKAYNSISKLPAPKPMLFKGSPYTVPKALPFTRPTQKPVYGTIKYYEEPEKLKHTGAFEYLRHNPNSLLASYIPSSLQIDYMKRGYTKDPLSAYEALSSSLYQNSNAAPPRPYQRGFRPNQMFQTAAGGVTYGTFKKSANKEKWAYN